ncbi:MAG: helix-hairpin-helix domain-containing protein [Bifidobacteriaceae bacterium]|jgi:competence ComEA-like helix-hairpin-helix protein|nr:helix-hairpin-helix domain-containing protein [Bifidobacteriaceae bacterium]
MTLIRATPGVSRDAYRLLSNAWWCVRRSIWMLWPILGFGILGFIACINIAVRVRQRRFTVAAMVSVVTAAISCIAVELWSGENGGFDGVTVAVAMWVVQIAYAFALRRPYLVWRAEWDVVARATLQEMLGEQRAPQAQTASGAATPPAQFAPAAGGPAYPGPQQAYPTAPPPHPATAGAYPATAPTYPIPPQPYPNEAGAYPAAAHINPAPTAWPGSAQAGPADAWAAAADLGQYYAAETPPAASGAPGFAAGVAAGAAAGLGPLGQPLGSDHQARRLGRRREVTMLGGAQPTAEPARAAQAASLDANTASAGELAQAVGIGRQTAERIVAVRAERGGFANLDDLTRAAGLQPHEALRLRGKVVFGVAPTRLAPHQGRILDV